MPPEKRSNTAIIILIVIVLLIAGFFIYRNRAGETLENGSTTADSSFESVSADVESTNYDNLDEGL